MNFSALLSPEGFLVITGAVILDIAGVICAILIAALGTGAILSYIPDAIGIISFGFWIFLRHRKEKGSVKAGKESIGKVADMAKSRKQTMSKAKGFRIGKLGKFGFSSLGELIPLVGALPFWTIFVLSELTS